MSQTIDSKVVEMNFDNRKFEQNVSTSLSTIDKLKKALNFDGMSKGFDDLGKSASSLNFSNVGSAIDTVKIKFTALQIAAVEAMRRIASSAYDTGVQLVKSLSIDNITTGWSKFEQKTQAVGTLIAQGYDMGTVEEQLDKLAWYTDETSYEFTTMVESIAKFTAAGQTLPDSVQSLMGIANWAALSGQNAQTASRAMYQLAQAMGAGVMRKEDYKSIQNVSMDTIEFRKVALEAGVAMGTLKKNADGTYTSIVKNAKKSTFSIGQFADHLTQEAWFTSDVMKSVYMQYSEAVDKIYDYVNEHGGTASDAIKALSGDLTEFQRKAFEAAQEARTWTDTIGSVQEAVASGWMKTFEIIFGNYEEAKELWTDLANAMYDAFAEPGNERNELLKGALKSSDPYIDQYFKKLAGLSDTEIQYIKDVGDEYGYASEQFSEYVDNISKGDPVISNLIKGFYQIQNGAESTTQSITMSSDALITSAATASKTSEENIKKLQEAGEAYGYNSVQVNRLMRQIYGGNYYTMEMVRNMLKLGSGMEEITSSGIDDYLKQNNKLTDEEIEHLKELQSQYGINADEINQYLKSLHRYNSSERVTIMGVLSLTEGLTESTTSAANLTGYIQSLTGASEDSVKSLQDFRKASKDASSSLDAYAESIAESDEQLSKILETIRGEGDLDSEKLVDQLKITKEQADALLILANSEKESTDEYEKLIKELSKGDPVLEETIRKLLDTNDELDDLSGRRNLVKAFWAIWEYGASVLEHIKEAFNKVFPPATADRIYGITVKIREFAEGLTLSEESADKLERIFSGVFSVFKIIGQVAKAAFIPIRDLFGVLFGSKETLMEGAASLGDWLTNLAESGVVAEKATEFFTNVSNVIQTVIEKLREFFQESFNWEDIKKTFSDAGGGIAGAFSVVSEKIDEVIGLVLDLVESFTGWDLSDAKKKVTDFIEDVGEAIGKWLPDSEGTEGLFGPIKQFFTEFGKAKDDPDVKEGIGVFSFIGGVIKSLGSILGTVGEKIKEFFSGIGEGLKSFSTEDLKDIARALSAIALALAAWFAVWNLSSFTDIADSFSKFFYSKALGSIIYDFAASVLMLSVAMLVLANIPEDRLMASILTLETLVATMVGVFEIVSWTSKASFTKGNNTAKAFGGMLKMAISMFLLAMTLERISKIPEKDLKRSANIMVLMVLALGVAEALIGTGKAGTQFAGALSAVILVGAVLVLAHAIVNLAKQAKENDILTAAGVMAGIMVVLSLCVAAFSIVGDAGSMAAGAASAIILALAVIAIAEEIMRLAKFAEDGDITTAVLIMAGITSFLTLAVEAFANPAIAGNMVKAIQGATATAILAEAIKIVSEAIIAMSIFCDPKDMVAAGLVLSGVALVLTLMVKTIAQINPASIMSAATGMVIAAAALNLIALAIIQVSIAAVIMSRAIAIITFCIKQLSELDQRSMTNAVVALLAMTGLIAVILALLSQIPGPQLQAAAAAFVAMSNAMLYMANALNIVSGVMVTFSEMSGRDFKEGIVRLAATLGVLLGALAVLEVIGYFAQFAAPGLMALGQALLVVTASVVVFGIGIMSIGIGLALAGKGLILMAAGLVALGAAAKTNGGAIVEAVKEVIKGVITMMPEILEAFVEAVGSLADAITENAPKLREAISAVMTMLIGIVLDSLVANLPDILEVVLSTLIGILDLLIARGDELVDKVLTLVEIVIQGCADHAEGIVDGVVQLVINVIKGLTDHLPEFVEAVVDFVMALFDSVILVMEKVGVEDLSGGIQAVTDLLAIMALLSGANLLAGTAMTGVLGIASVVAEILLLMAALGYIAQIPGVDLFFEKFGDFDSQQAISTTEDFVTIMALLSGANLLVPTAMTGILGVASVVAELIAILALLGGIAQIPGLEWLVNEGIDLLVTVGEGVGKFVGAILEGVVDSVSNTLPEFGAALSSFMDNVQVFIDGASKIDGTVKTGVDNLVAAILAILGAEVLSFITEIATLGPLGDAMFVDKLTNLGTAIAGFGEAVSSANIDIGKVEAAVKIAGILGDLMGAQLESTANTILTLGLGDSMFEKKLKSLADGLVGFASEVSNANNINIEKVDQIVTVAKKLSEIQNELGSTGGIIEFFTGNSDLGTFGDTIASFAESMGKFVIRVNSLSITDSSIEKVDSIITVSDKLNDLQGHLEPILGLKQFLVGHSDLGTFGQDLIPFIDGMTEFLNKLTWMPLSQTVMSKIDDLITVSTKLSDLQKSLDDILGLVDIITGTDDLGTFGSNMSSYADGMMRFLDKIQELPDDTSSVDKMIDITKSLSEFQKTLEPIGGIKKLLEGFDDLGTFGESMRRFGTKLKQFVESLSGMKDADNKIELASKLTNAVSGLVNSLPKTKTSFSAIKDGLSGMADAVADFANKWAAIGIEAFTNLPQQARFFVEAIQILTGANYGNGGQLPGIVTTAAETVEQVVEILEGGSEGAGKAGTNLFTSYDNSAQTRAEETKEDIRGAVERIGDSTVYQTGKEGNRINESIMLWGEDGVEHLNSDEVHKLFGDVPVAWVSTMIGSTTGKSPEFYDTLRKLASQGSASMTANDIMTLYNEGGTALVQALIDGGSLKAEDVTDKLREAIMGGVKNGDVLNEGIIKAYFDLGGRLDKELANGLAKSGGDFGDAIKKLVTDGAGSLSGKDLVELYKKGGKGLIDNIIDGWGGDKKAFKDTVEQTIRDGKKVDSATLKLFQDLGGELDDKMVLGLRNGGNKPVNEARTVVKNVNTAASQEDNSYDLGEDYSQGYANGIKKKASKAVDEAKKMVQNVNKIISTTQMSESPSKVAAKLGGYYSEGYAIGISSMIPMVESTAKDTVESAIQVMSDSLSSLSSVDLESLGDGLTLRPVMDLSEIQNGVNQIGTMMNGVDGYAISGSMDSAWAAAASMGFTGSTNPQQDSIDKLNQTVKELANRPPKQITQNYTIVSDDPEEIYEYISARMQNDVIREDSVWA